jgi:hypothetical protein
MTHIAMIKRPDHRYLNFTIAICIWPVRVNRYASSFSINEGADGSPAQRLPLIYKEGRDVGMSCETADEAHQDALERAYEWINAKLQ